ncbi:hypothetical protein S7711_08473 [Stachybotrys chartarum IBT 7711]|uniref:Amidase domain-containing protein n=1 Tax=Stachybotrys chartarum (strain CBS 109288 / IBT 7711) TaxID=1280523 RepID=A0A084AGI8_STACB|nr:hypothetical protein S7711_08473 [Stachybotrys chartarum IBT 7711]
MAKSIAVPSRLYYTATEEQPLACLRFGVKDIFHVKGVGTIGGKRAYFYLYGNQNHTAPSIQRLIDLADWVDLHASFNPRGDGYQDPRGSSTGPGADIAAYEWLHLAVGSDTGGSMCGPAGAQGVFGNRPSTGAISLDHVIPLSPVSDTAGIFARSGDVWARATKAWYPDFRSNYTFYPSKIYRSTSSRAAWTAVTLGEEALAMIPFFEGCAAKFDGRQPYINPGPLERWQWAQGNAPEEVYAQALHNISLFKDWYETDGYGRHDAETCSEGLCIYPWSIGVPSYRDTYLSVPTRPPLGFDESSAPVMAGAPEVVVPIGEVPYDSIKTLQTGYLPVTMALRMARGCDFILADFIRDLESEGILRPVAAGTRLFP